MFIHESGSKEDPLVLLLAPMMVSGEDLYQLMHLYFTTFESSLHQPSEG